MSNASPLPQDALYGSLLQHHVPLECQAWGQQLARIGFFPTEPGLYSFVPRTTKGNFFAGMKCCN